MPYPIRYYPMTLVNIIGHASIKIDHPRISTLLEGEGYLCVESLQSAGILTIVLVEMVEMPGKNLANNQIPSCTAAPWRISNDRI